MKKEIVKGFFCVLQRTGLSLFLLCLFFSHNQLLLKAENIIVEKNLGEISLTKIDQDTLQQYLDYLSLGLIGFSEDEKFKEILYKEILNKFDDDYNVLFNTLIEECKVNGIDLIQEMENYIYLEYQETIDFKNVLNKCKINGLYPQIYVPVFEGIDKNRLAIDLLSGKNPVILADRISKNKSPFYQGQHFNRKNKHIEDFMVNEEYSQNNEVWVVSFNERTDAFGKLKHVNPVEVVLTNKNLTNASLSALGLGRDLYIDKITLPDYYELESWTRGGPELYVKIYCCKQGEFAFAYFHGTRAEFKSPTWYNANRFIRYWDYGIHGDALYFFWWESDNDLDGSNQYGFNFGCDIISHYTVWLNIAEDFGGGRPVHKDENIVFLTDLNLVKWTLK